MPSTTTLEGGQQISTAPGAAAPSRATTSQPERAAEGGPQRLVFVGPVVTDAPNGSTVKNRYLIDGLRDHGVDVRLIDTMRSGGRARVAQFGALLRSLGWSRQVVMSVSNNGFYTLVSLLGLLSATVPGLRFAVVGMGSGMPRQVDSLKGLARRYFSWALGRATGVYVQGEWIRRELEDLGISNASVLANLRPRPAVRWDPSTLSSGRLVFISRVIPDKGVERAMAAVERLRAEGMKVSLDIYGPMPADYATRFETLLAESPGSTYHGVLAPERVLDVLASHAALVLPTKWAQEGMPGILVEAAMVGMPVLASDLVPIAEVVENGVTGVLVDPDDESALVAATRRLLEDPQRTMGMADALNQRATAYDIDVVIGALNRHLAKSGWR